MSSSHPYTTSTERSTCILQRLRHETRPEHDAIERTPMMRALFAPGFDVTRYRSLLALQFGFYQPLEARLAPYPHLGGAGRSSHLARDLATLGLTLAELAHLPRCRQLPAINDDLAAAGCSYVLEGAALGGRVINKRLLEALPESVHAATDFYRGDGAATAARWRAFQNRLQATAASCPERMDAIVTAAQQTFSMFTAWLQQPLSLQPSDLTEPRLRLSPRTTTLDRNPCEGSIRSEELTCHA